MHHEWLAVGQRCSCSFPAWRAANGAESTSRRGRQTLWPRYDARCAVNSVLSAATKHTHKAPALVGHSHSEMRHPAINVLCPPAYSEALRNSPSTLKFSIWSLFFSKQGESLEWHHFTSSCCSFASFQKFTTSEGNSLDRKKNDRWELWYQENDN